MNWDDVEHRLRSRLDPLDRAPRGPFRSDRDLNPDWHDLPAGQTPAAVLAPIVRRPGGWTVLLTQRTNDTPAHAGQIAFPGGRTHDNDADALETALRETEEEIGLRRRFIEPIGSWDRYATGSGFDVTPIAAFVDPGFELQLDPREVAEVFETPLSFLLDPANHERREALWQGRMRAYYAMPYGERLIWGVTAGMIRALYERLYT